ncbi:MAG: hypothetical protein R3A44_30830 [Caldilineaceae bacterium]
MLKIGGIYLTREFFDILVDGYVATRAEQVLSMISHRNQLPDRLCEQLEAFEDPYPNSLDYLTALIRVQTEDYVHSDQEIQTSEPYKEIISTASEQADREFAAKFSPNDLLLIASIAEELGINLPTGQER